MIGLKGRNRGQFLMLKRPQINWVERYALIRGVLGFDLAAWNGMAL